LTRLVLCRHAEAGNAKEANELAAVLASVHFDAVYTSPLERALATSRAVAAQHRLVPVEVADLREIDLGEVEGLSFGQLPAELQAELLGAPLTVRFPGGETYGELRDAHGPDPRSSGSLARNRGGGDLPHRPTHRLRQHRGLARGCAHRPAR